MNWQAALTLDEWACVTEHGDQWAAGRGDYIDGDNFIAFLAIHARTRERAAFDCDLWLYRDETKGAAARWMFILRDMDMTLAVTRDDSLLPARAACSIGSAGRRGCVLCRYRG